MESFIVTVLFIEDGYNMYTKLLRKLNQFILVVSGHCGGGSGHCSAKTPKR